MRKGTSSVVFTVVISTLLYFVSVEAIERGKGKLNSPFDHTLSYNGAMHKPGLLKPFYVNRNSQGEGTGIDPEAEGTSGGCVICHGETSGYTELTGGITENGLTPPSCFSCHSKNWLDDPRTPIADFTFNSPPSHVETRRGRPHRLDHASPNSGLPNFEGNQNYGMCVVCHGNDLKGGVPWTNKAGVTTTPPSCYTCHGNGGQSILLYRQNSILPPAMILPTAETISAVFSTAPVTTILPVVSPISRATTILVCVLFVMVRT